MRYRNDLDLPQFFTAETCKAANVSADILKSWISRDPPAILLTKEDRPAGGSGRPHLFSLRRVLQIAITGELVGLGFGPRQAGLIALSFTDVGDGASDPSERPRGPGEVYPDGLTILIARRGQSSGVVRKVTLKTPWFDLMIAGAHIAASSIAVVDVSSINRRVREALGLPLKLTHQEQAGEGRTKSRAVRP